MKQTTPLPWCCLTVRSATLTISTPSSRERWATAARDPLGPCLSRVPRQAVQSGPSRRHAVRAPPALTVPHSPVEDIRVCATAVGAGDPTREALPPRRGNTLPALLARDWRHRCGYGCHVRGRTTNKRSRAVRATGCEYPVGAVMLSCTTYVQPVMSRLGHTSAAHHDVGHHPAREPSQRRCVGLVAPRISISQGNRDERCHAQSGTPSES